MNARRFLITSLIALAGAALAACGGGGNTTSYGGQAPFISSGGGATPVPTATPIPGPVTVTGLVVSIPSSTVNGTSTGGYGPNAPQTPLSGATVIIGPVLVTGATPPPAPPAGDVMVTTTASGTYSATVASGPAASVSTQSTYVHPPNDLSGFTPPTVGYYISVFAAGSDGHSAGAPLPVHAFSGLSAGTVLTTQRVTTASADEAAFLALVNHDRTTANAVALPMVFDEYAEEAARQHVSEEAAGNFYCHYNALNVGPGSRYLGFGAVGQDDENVGKTAGQPNAAGSYTATQVAFMAEAPTNGGHYTNIIDSTHAWAGVATLLAATTDQYVDQEFVSPNGIAPFVYPNFAGSACPPGVTPNNS